MNTINRNKIDIGKLTKLPTVNDDLDQKYGKSGTVSREKFAKEAHAYYTGQLFNINIVFSQ